MYIAKSLKDYEIIKMSSGMKLERWNNYYLYRPDPEIIWNEDIDLSKVDAIYHRSKEGGGHWDIKNNLPSSWHFRYDNLTFLVKLMGFKHTGVFPEQSVNWDFMRDKIKNCNRKVKVLNLFAYTGCASVCCLDAGAEVVHVDSSRGMVDFAKENVKLNNLEDKPIRFLIDDVVKFVSREIRRGNKYDAIIMDPPSFGRGANKEVWQIDKDLFNLVELCMQILVDEPLFFIINSYTAGLSSTVLENILQLKFGKKSGTITCGELGLKAKDGLVLPCGVFGRYESK